jgi:hypothetical protein
MKLKSRSLAVSKRELDIQAHACNPRHSGGRDQEDLGSKPALANSSQDYLKKPFTKIGLVEWLKVKALSSSPSTTKKKKNKPSLE